MSKIQVECCIAITKDYFGPDVANVLEYLASNGPLPFKMISIKAKISKDIVRKSLWVLIQHNFVDFHITTMGFAVYKANLGYILQRNRQIRFIYMCKCFYGEESKAVLEDVVKNGRVKMDDTIDSLVKSSNMSRKLLKDKFNQLIQEDLLLKCPLDENLKVKPPSTTATTTTTTTTNNNNKDENDPNPGVNSKKRRRNVIESDEEDEDGDVDNDDDDGNRVGVEGAVDRGGVKSGRDEPAAKKFKSEDYWRLNTVKFNEYLRNQVIVEAIAMKIDKVSADIMKIILKLSDLNKPINNNNDANIKTSGVSFNEIFACLKKQSTSLSPSVLDQMLRILTEDASQFLVKDGDSGGGIYKVDFRKAMLELCTAHVASVVQERYGSKSLRIFRVIMLKKKLEQKQIEDLAMIDPKEAKELLYRLLEDNIVTLTEVPRTADHAPQKTIFLFSINLTSIARMLLDKCYKAMANLITRRLHETTINKRVIDKQKRLEIILAQIDPDDLDQRKELEDQMASSEKDAINNYRKTCDVLDKSELQLDETIFVLESYLSLC